MNDMVIRSPIANRRDTRFDGLIEFFVNPPILRLRITLREALPELLASVRQNTVDAYRHQNVHFTVDSGIAWR